MVKVPGKGHFKRATTGKGGTFERAATGHEGAFKPKFEIECGFVIYKFMSLSIMQLLSVLFRSAKYTTYLIIILETGLLFEHTLI